MRVLGKTDLTLLPSPSLTFENVRIGNDIRSPLMVVDQFFIDIEPFALLSGEIRIVKMELGRPVLNVTLDKNNTFNWTSGSGKNIPLMPDKVIADGISITDGKLVFSDETVGRTLEFDRINANVSARSLAGPFKLDGWLRYDDVDAAISLSTGILVDGEVVLKTRISPKRKSLPGVFLDGIIAFKNSGPEFEGKFELKRSLEQKEIDEGQLPLLIEGTLQATTRDIIIPELNIKHGPEGKAYSLDGSASIKIAGRPRFKANLTSRQIDLDRLLGAKTGEGVDVEEAIAGLVESLKQIPIPTIPGLLDVKIPGLVINGGYVRNVEFEATPFDDGWAIEKFQASLPGVSRLSLRGRILLRDAARFNGSGGISSSQPRALANWLRPGQAQPGYLAPFEFESDLDFGQSSASLTDVTGSLGNSAITGSVRWNSNDKKLLALKIRSDRLDLDELKGLAGLFAGTSKITRLPGITIDIKADEVVIDRHIARDVLANVKFVEGDLDVTKFSIGEVSGASVSGHGVLESLFDQPTGEMILEVEALDLTGLSALASKLTDDHPASVWFSSSARSLSPAKFTATVSGDKETSGNRFGFTMKGSLGGSEIDADIGLRGRLIYWRDLVTSIGVTIKNEHGDVFLRQAGLSVLPRSLPARTVTLFISGQPVKGLTLTLRSESEDEHFLFTGMINLDEQDRPIVTGNLDTKIADAGKLLAVTGIPLVDFSFPQQFQAEADIKYHLGQLDATLKNGDFGGQRIDAAIKLDTTRLRPSLTGSVDVEQADLDWLIMLLAGQNRVFDEFQELSTTGFTAPLISGINMDLEVKADRMYVPIGSFIGQPKMRVRLKNSSIIISDLEGDYLGGQLKGRIAFSRIENTGIFEARLKLSDLDASTISWQHQQRPVLTGKFSTNFSVEGTGRSMTGILSSLGGEGTFTLADGEARYINPAAFDLVIRAADAGLELSDEAVRTAFEHHMNSGTIAFGEIDGTFSIASGVMRSRNIQMDTEKISAKSNFQLDLSAQSLKAETSILIDPGDDQVAGGLPQAALLFNGNFLTPTRSIDVSPLVGYLNIRALEREVARVENLQTVILERERFNRFAKSLRQRREAAIRAEEERLKRQEQEKLEAFRLEVERLETARKEALQQAADLREEKRKAAERAAEQLVLNRQRAVKLKAEKLEAAKLEAQRQIVAREEAARLKIANREAAKLAAGKAARIKDEINSRAVESVGLPDIPANGTQGQNQNSANKTTKETTQTGDAFAASVRGALERSGNSAHGSGTAAQTPVITPRVLTTPSLTLVPKGSTGVLALPQPSGGIGAIGSGNAVNSTGSGVLNGSIPVIGGDVVGSELEKAVGASNVPATVKKTRVIRQTTKRKARKRVIMLPNGLMQVVPN